MGGGDPVMLHKGHPPSRLTPYSKCRQFKASKKSPKMVTRCQGVGTIWFLCQAGSPDRLTHTANAANSSELWWGPNHQWIKVTTQQIDLMQQIQLICISGGRGPVFSVKRSPNQQTEPMQPIYMNGGGDPVISTVLTFKLFSEGHCGQ